MLTLQHLDEAGATFEVVSGRLPAGLFYFFFVSFVIFLGFTVVVGRPDVPLWGVAMFGVMALALLVIGIGLSRHVDKVEFNFCDQQVIRTRRLFGKPVCETILFSEMSRVIGPPQSRRMSPSTKAKGQCELWISVKDPTHAPIHLVSFVGPNANIADEAARLEEKFAARLGVPFERMGTAASES